MPEAHAGAKKAVRKANACRIREKRGPGVARGVFIFTRRPRGNLDIASFVTKSTGPRPKDQAFAADLRDADLRYGVV